MASTSASFAGRGGRLQIDVLADDLFRVRASRSADWAPRHSIAVDKQNWDPVPCAIDASRQKVEVRTRSGILRAFLPTDQWEIQDFQGKSIFQWFQSFRDTAQLRFQIEHGDSFFGLGETTGTFNKFGSRKMLWNADVLGHNPGMHPALLNLYASVPFLLRIRHGLAAGIFFDNPARQVWDIGQKDDAEWTVEVSRGEVDLYLFLGPTVQNVVSRYTELTGRMSLPPRWALGYHQCRYSYETRARVEQLARDFRARRIPCDAIYLDIHHMREYRVFTFGPGFRKPAEMMRRLARLGFRVVTIVDPGVMDDARFGVMQRGLSRGVFVKSAQDSDDFLGKVWPGVCRFPDFMSGGVRAWWAEEQARFHQLGISGFWVDMNEPAVFDTPAKTLPEDCVHHADTGTASHGDVHNLYGMQMARATWEGARKHAPGRRPFVVSRSGYAGIQRYALLWTGDNTSSWEHLADSIQMLLNLSLSGIPFCGADVGGFTENATGELLARWTQMAVFTPFFRNHSNIGTRVQEPWAFGPEIEEICRQAIELRYQLFPYIYSQFIEAHRHGTPIMRPLLWDYASDPRAVAAGDQFLLGPALLVAPILSQGATARSVYLPQGSWHDFWTGQVHQGGQHVLALANLATIPLFVRSGSILPFLPIQQFMGEKNPKVADLHVWLGGSGSFAWYEDDGETEGYRSGASVERLLQMSGDASQGQLRIGPASGRYVSQVRRWRIVIRGAKHPLDLETSGGRAKARHIAKDGLSVAEIPNRPGEIILDWRKKQAVEK